MSIVRRWLRRTRDFAEALSLRSKVGIVLPAAAVLIGAVWLAARTGGGPERTGLSEIDGGDLPRAMESLQSNGIAAQVEDGRLTVSTREAGKARTVLAYEGLTGQNLLAVFEQLSRESDMWSTADQNDKRWQAAKMTTLSRLIGMFPPVRTATVIYEQGNPRRLGGGGSEPTASVRVALKPDATMDSKLVTAIADLVSGSVAGMSRQNVHVIDNGGRSYRVNEEGLPDSTDRLEQLRLAEDMVRQRIGQALAHLPNVSVAVRFEARGQDNQCAAVSLALPRTCVLAMLPPDQARQGLDDQELQTLARRQFDEIRQVVMSQSGLREASAVTISLFRDAPSSPAAAAKSASALGQIVLWIAAMATAAVGCGALVVIMRRRRGVEGSVGQAEGPSQRSEDDDKWMHSVQDTFAFLSGVEPAALSECLRGEHPQTVATVLAQIDPDKSAAVLGSLAPVQQVEVSRRILALERIDPEVTVQIAQTLRQRLAQGAGASGASGMAIITRILHQADPAVERSVLNALSTDEPALADSIRRRLTSFDDISHLPSFRVRAALETFGSEELAVALRTAGDELKAKILGSISETSAQRLRDEMERMGPVRLSDVESAQQRVTEAIRQSEAGTYIAAGAVSERLA